jgi:hypothetical protein
MSDEEIFHDRGCHLTEAMAKKWLNPEKKDTLLLKET